jgi:hypothetical protein
LALLAPGLADEALGAEVEWFGAATVDAGAVRGAGSSFLAGGWGRFGVDGRSGASEWSGSLGADFGLVWTPSPGLRVVAHGLGRLEDDDIEGDAAGLVELFADLQRAVGDRHQIGVRAGLFFPATSFENVERGWHSPYTLTLSAINSWVGEESRELGVEARWTAAVGDGRLTLGGALGGGNDTAGTLLAWRGFSMHDRLTTLGETIALPRLASLEDDGIFGVQRDQGTRPLTEDLDGRVGWSSRVGWRDDRRGVTARLRVADNRGDRELHGDQYAWRTRTVAAGVGVDRPSGWSILAELLHGDTGMGTSPHFVDVDFAAGYVLVSRRWDVWRASVRMDRFETRDRDGSIGEVSDEDGRAVTVALLRQAGPWRVGLELLALEIDRPSGSGFLDDGDGEIFRLELRRSW